MEVVNRLRRDGVAAAIDEIKINFVQAVAKINLHFGGLDVLHDANAPDFGLVAGKARAAE